MTKQTQITETQSDKNKRPTGEPTLPELGHDLADVNLVVGNLVAAGDGSAQIARLNDGRWLTAQRQALASQIGRVQGNRHLQRVMAPLKTVSGKVEEIQRQPADPNALTDEKRAKIEEQKTEFRKDPHQLTNYQPSTNLGKFDAVYDPKSGTLKIIVKIAFDFKDAPDAPSWALMDETKEKMRKLTWSDEEKETYMSEFAGAAASKWGQKYTINCTKPYWEEFVANTQIVVAPWMGVHPDAHYQVKVEKYSEETEKVMKKDPSAGPRAEVLAPKTPDEQGSGIFYGDSTERKPSNNAGVVSAEMSRLRDGLKGSGATTVSFDADSDTVKNTGPITQFASVLNSAYPSAPAIPIEINGYLGDGDSLGEELAKRRADAVALVLANAGVLQPLRPKGFNDPQGRQVSIVVNNTPSNTNLRRVSDHEFGHILGLPDEYAAQGDERESEGHKHAEEKFKQLVSSAGVAEPAMGKDTSSIMSVGVDVLPAHYVTIKEALGKMTSKHIGESEWQITA